MTVVDSRVNPLIIPIHWVTGIVLPTILVATSPIIEHVNRRSAGAHGIDQVLGIIDSPRLRGRIRKGHSNECEDDAAERSS